MTRDQNELKASMPAFTNDVDDSGSGDGSPYRGGNYDLLLVLATRRATKYFRPASHASRPAKLPP